MQCQEEQQLSKLCNLKGQEDFLMTMTKEQKTFIDITFQNSKITGEGRAAEVMHIMYTI